MSRSGYSDECDNLQLWRGAVRSAINGKRGQQFLRELAAAMDAMPVKQLVADSFQQAEGQFCTLGTVGAARGLDMTGLEECEDTKRVGRTFGIAPAMAAEIMFENDEHGWYSAKDETPADRWTRMRKWVADHTLPQPPAPAS